MDKVAMAQESLLFQQHPSLLVRSIPLMSLISASYLAFSEINGKHIHYSKFRNDKTSSLPNSKYQINLSGKIGMLIIYTPAFLAGLASFALFPDGDLRFLLVKFAITVHFFKRVLEVLFVHKYSGGIHLNSVIFISASYLFAAVSTIYAQQLARGLQEPSIDLKFVGCLVFLAGIYGNFYHHWLLAKLRIKGEKGYKLPKGGMFDLVVCPHYLFEVIAFFGIFLISQTLLSLSSAVGVALYLTGRSYMTRKWYLSKLDNFAPNTKALIPFVF